MRTALLMLLLAAISTPIVKAGFVDHQVLNGIVAVDGSTGPFVLDSFGQVWEPPYGSNPNWQRHAWADIPLPVDQIRFWERTVVVTLEGEALTFWNGVWTNGGIVPSASSVDPKSEQNAWIGKAMPNPTVGKTSIEFSLDTEANVEAWIHDSLGRVVRRFGGLHLGVGTHQIDWDGRDDRGSDVPAGVYFSRIDAGSVTIAERIVVTR